MEYDQEIKVAVEVNAILGINAFVKKEFDKLIKKIKVDVCKQKKWKLRDCDVSAGTKITVTFSHKLKESEQTIDWEELLEEK